MGSNRHARTQGDDSRVHVFSGKEEPAKEVECVLIYDEDSGVSRLEAVQYNWLTIL